MLTCPTCGNEEPERAQFCGNCGTPFVSADPEPPGVEPRPPPSPGGQHRLRWFAVGAAGALLVAGVAVGAALALTRGDGSTAATPTSDEQNVSSEDCLALGNVAADFTVGANPDVIFNLALDISASNYLVDRDFLDSYSDRAPEEIRSDVVRLALWVDRYATAMQAAGFEPGTLPTPESDQAGEIRGASQIGSIEQDQLPGSIEALGLWAAGGCSGGRPPTGTALDPLTFPTTEADTTAPSPVGLTDEEVTALVNEAMSQRTEADRNGFGSPLGAEVRDCRFAYEAANPSYDVWYACDVWYEGEVWLAADEYGGAGLDINGNVVSLP